MKKEFMTLLGCFLILVVFCALSYFAFIMGIINPALHWMSGFFAGVICMFIVKKEKV